MSGRTQPRIRLFRQSDVGALRQLIGAVIDVSYAAVYPPRALAFFKDFHAASRILERARAGVVLVAEEQGALVGTGSLVDGEIFAVFVHPERQRGGLGKALMRELEERARASGVTESLLSVSLPSKRFYEGLGYEIVEDCARDFGDGQRMDFWKARKRLAPVSAGG